VNLSKEERDAILSELKTEARKLGLEDDSDKFWTHVWKGVEAACIESGDLPRPRKRRAKAPA